MESEAVHCILAEVEEHGAERDFRPPERDRVEKPAEEQRDDR
jgi:hypothetical protein